MEDELDLVREFFGESEEDREGLREFFQRANEFTKAFFGKNIIYEKIESGGRKREFSFSGYPLTSASASLLTRLINENFDLFSRNPCIATLLSFSLLLEEVFASVVDDDLIERRNLSQINEIKTFDNSSGVRLSQFVIEYLLDAVLFSEESRFLRNTVFSLKKDLVSRMKDLQHMFQHQEGVEPNHWMKSVSSAIADSIERAFGLEYKKQINKLREELEKMKVGDYPKYTSEV